MASVSPWGEIWCAVFVLDQMKGLAYGTDFHFFFCGGVYAGLWCTLKS